VQEVIRTEEEAFNKTLDRGIELFREETECMRSGGQLKGDFAFKLYDTYGFPLDLTELMARERGLSVDVAAFNELMNEQKARARAAQKKEVISLSNIETATPSRFVGYDQLQADGTVVEVVHHKDKTAVILDASPCYAEMGGQVGDTGEITSGATVWYVIGTQKSGNSFLHLVSGEDAPAVGAAVKVRVDIERRNAIQRHHTVTHLLHWALHEVVSKEASQKGSFVGPEKLTFDFNCAPLTRQQVLDIEKLVNERVVENAGVTWLEVPYSEVKGRKNVMQFFGDKYGDRVRVVQIGGGAGQLNGYSMELCGGTHTRATGEIGLFRIVSEAAIASGVRRIEAVAGQLAYAQARKQAEVLESIAAKLNSPLSEIEKKIDGMIAHQKELEKQSKAQQQREAADLARSLAAKATKVGSLSAIVENLGPMEGDFLQMILEALPGDFKGVAVVGGANNGTAALVARVSSDLTKQIQAGKIIQAIAPIVGGKGGGRPEFARGGGKEGAKLNEALAKARELIQAAR
jgi:alanyl-tRNA synthetase